MLNFEIKDEFMINGKPFKFYSGAVHYFRIAPSQWEFTLKKMKAAGLNTVETYIPWNVHEPIENQFNFSGQYDIERFIKLAQQIGLYVIVRPSPYICAEWEFGGLPAWLLKYSDMVVRTNTPRFIEKVAKYYHELFKRLVPLQFTHGGPILMMQVENEYGSFGNDKSYLRTIEKLMKTNGVDVPLFTSDGSWEQALSAGSLIEDDVLVTANFGSHVKENLSALKKFLEKHHKNWPLMCMEFWDGWFNRWNEEIIKRDNESFKKDLGDLINAGASFNLYMFRGGSNWGFFNGCSSRYGKDLPQITSYDYDAVLHEDGTDNGKYQALCDLLKRKIAVDDTAIKLEILPSVNVKRQVFLVDVLDELATKVSSNLPQTMENVGSGYGYIFYRTSLEGKYPTEKIRLVDVGDRIDIYLNKEKKTTLYQPNNFEEIDAKLTEKENLLELLVENVGRVNYSDRLLSPTQSKGIRTGIMVDRHFHYGWDQWGIDLQKVENVSWNKKSENKYGPTLNKFEFTLTKPVNTYIDCSNFGKGVVIVNGHNVGRYWDVGPTQSLYIPADFFKTGRNSLIVFETTDKYVNKINFIQSRELF
ncbi:beta-galactosidase family protein [Pediococcus acidilactici]